MRYTYSRWDGVQEVSFDPDAVMEALSDDLMADGDLWNALQRITRWGLQSDGQQQVPGLQNLLQQLRAQRQRELEHYNLDSMMRNIEQQVADTIQTEREGIERKLEEARGRDGDEGLQQLLETIAQRKRDYLDALPREPGPAIASLADYEFLDDRARKKFEALLDTLQQQVLQSQFQSIQQSLRQMTGAELHDLKEMLRDLDQLLRDRLEEDGSGFDRFMEQHGRHFPGAKSVDELIAQLQEQASHMEALLRSMSPEMRRSLESMMEGILRDEELQERLADIAEAIQAIAPFQRPRHDYPFSGTESLTLDEALDLMRRLHALDDLERQMKRSQDTGNLDGVDSEQVGRLLGEEAGRAVDQLKQLTRVLEEAGYVEQRGDSFELTARGVRRIGQKALQDIFSHLKRDAFGRHTIPVLGAGGDRADASKPYEFGDSFLLDLNQTLMNAIYHEGIGRPVKLAVTDFEVFRTEYLTQASTVLMLDMSRSMPLRGCFVAAKKVALALNSLIRTQYPRDHLYIIGFSDYARELRPDTLHRITWGDYVYGTNMQHGFVLARRLLGRHKGGNKQIILITDGEPTAHFEGDRVYFAYPPTFRTFQETLREVKRCTREGITINTFMLERSHYLADFVNQMTRINRGRAFFATPERLGDYILVDYVANKQQAGHYRGR